MDELEFLKGLKTDEEQFNELTAGAEHFIRLKKQSEQPTESEKAASSKAIRSAVMMAHGAKAAVKNRADLLARNVKAVANSKNPSSIRSFEAGMLLGKAAPAAAVGAGAYAVGKHKGKKDAEDEIYGKYASAEETEEKRQRLGHRLVGASLGSTIGTIAGNRRRAPFIAGAGVGALAGPKLFGSSEDLKEKRASLAEKLKSIGPLAGGLMAGGAAAGGIGTYLASKPQDELGGKSRAEDELEASVEAQKGRPERGLLHKMKNRTTELEHGYAQAFRDHPVKASLLGAAAGASGGYGLARLLDALRHGAK